MGTRRQAPPQHDHLTKGRHHTPVTCQQELIVLFTPPGEGVDVPSNATHHIRPDPKPEFYDHATEKSIHIAIRGILAVHHLDDPHAQPCRMRSAP